jgi:hypothetical protein
MARKLVVGLLVAWALAGFADEAWRALRARGRPGRVPPMRWRMNTPPVRHLAFCLEEVRRRIPAGSSVLFHSANESGEPAHYQWRWAVYLLPEAEVLPLQEGKRRRRAAGYLVAYRGNYSAPDARLVAELPGCALYEIVGTQQSAAP